MFLLAASTDAVLGLVMLDILKRQEAVEIGHHLEHDIAPAATISPIGAPFGNVFLAAERCGAIATVSGTDVDPRLIDKHVGSPYESAEWNGNRTPGRIASCPVTARHTSICHICTQVVGSR
jgi:hypothetical protein